MDKLNLQTNPFSFLPKLKCWVDAKDSNGIWRLGRVKKNLEDDSLLVSFDGWSEKYNQIFPLNSTDVAPLRMHTRGYTGQLKITLRDYELHKSFIELMAHKMALMNRTKLTAFSAYEINMFLRADLFVLVDDIFTRQYIVLFKFCIIRKKDSEEELAFLPGFVKTFLDLFKTWLNLLTNLLEKVCIFHID